MTLVNKLSNIDPAGNINVVDGQPLSGYIKGVFTSIVFNSDAFTPEKGSDGEDNRFLANDFSAVATITLMQSSDSNDYLSDLHNEDLSTAKKIFTFTHKDSNGSTLLESSRCYILKFADVTIGNTSQGRAWRIHCPNLKGKVGGNTAL